MKVVIVRITILSIPVSTICCKDNHKVLPRSHILGPTSINNQVHKHVVLPPYYRSLRDDEMITNCVQSLELIRPAFFYWDSLICWKIKQKPEFNFTEHFAEVSHLVPAKWKQMH